MIEGGSNCNKIQLSFRNKGGRWVLNSATGDVVKKQAPSAASAGGARLARKGGGFKRVTKTSTVGSANATPRLTVSCPKGRFALGGGISAAPGISPDGEGIYPHSSERLGVQRGWHITPILFKPETSETATTARKVTMQTVCGPERLTPDTTVHRTVFLRPNADRTPGNPGSATARCPKGQYLLSGGFNRANFTDLGGGYATESHAVGTKGWTVAGRAHGKFGSELTAIAYCMRSKRPLLSAVKGSAAVPAGGAANATTRRCPKGRKLTVSGFSAGSDDVLVSGGSLNANGSSSSSAYGFFGAGSLTAYGYCLRVKG